MQNLSLRALARGEQSSQEEKSGKGIYMYQNPRELEARLMIMIGSIKAGNTSRELKRDVRRILDEMLKINYITLKQHRPLYQKTAAGGTR